MKFVQFCQNSNVKIYWGYKLIDTLFSNHGFLSSVSIKDKRFEDTVPVSEEVKEGEDYEEPPTTIEYPTIDIPCITLLLCSKSHCEMDVFSAINDSGLVFDGGMVVNEVYR